MYWTEGFESCILVMRKWIPIVVPIEPIIQKKTSFQLGVSNKNDSLDHLNFAMA